MDLLIENTTVSQSLWNTIYAAYLVVSLKNEEHFPREPFPELVRVVVGRTIMQTAIELFAPGFVPLRGLVAVAYVLHSSYI